MAKQKFTLNLKAALELGEGQFIEFKELFDKSLSREMVAFANASGGVIYLGITDKGKIKGFETTNKLKSQIQNTARNCLLVDLLARTDFMEKAGTGIKRVTNACNAKGNKCIFNFSDAFWVTMKTNNKDNVPDNVPDKRTELVLELIKKNNQILLKELAGILKVSTRTIRRDIEKLKNMNKLKRIGSEKSGYWKIINDN